jgi:DNA (cytosine-5)-methyltransferase 1
MKYLSVCSGIEAATVAWHPLGWQAVGYSEIEKFPSQVLAHHYPDVTNYGDMTKYKEWSIDSTVDLLVGGTPCQSFSVAGLRKGLDDPRGNLMLTYLAIADKFKPKWLVWENVPGVLSSNSGKDFGVFLGALGELGYGFAYRILDAQYFGVAQRRRRVFVVGYLGDWRSAAAVLFERHSLSGDPAPSRQKRQGVTSSIKSSSPNGDETIGTLMARDYKGVGNRDLEDGRGLVLNPIALAENTIGRQPENGGNGDGFTDGGPMYTLNATGVHGVAQPISFDMAQITSKVNGTRVEPGLPVSTLAKGSQMHVAQPVYEMHGQDSRVRDLGETCSTVTSKWDTGGGNVPISLQQMVVRRLTPIECERLQGFGDNYTDIQPKGKPTPDGPRYKALGNSMAVPVMAWIGKRIQEVERLSERNAR